MAFYELEPWGERVAYHRAGIVTSAIINMMSGKGARQMKPTDFIPVDAEGEEKLSPDVVKIKRTLMKAVRGE